MLIKERYRGHLLSFSVIYCKILSVQDFADVKYAMCTLRTGSVDKLDNPSDPNDVSSTDVIWTKETNWLTAETEWHAQYTLQESPPDMTNHYVQKFLYGIVNAIISLQYISGTGK